MGTERVAAIGGAKRVRKVLLPWFARGWLRGEKTEQYFDALAKSRRTKDVSVPKDQGTGRRRQAP